MNVTMRICVRVAVGAVMALAIWMAGCGSQAGSSATARCLALNGANANVVNSMYVAVETAERDGFRSSDVLGDMFSGCANNPATVVDCRACAAFIVDEVYGL